MIRTTLKTALVAAAGLFQAANAVTIYTDLPGTVPTGIALPAFDPIQLQPPAPPAAGAVPTAVPITLLAGTVPGLNPKQHRPDFVGVSIELSVSDRIIGTNGTWLSPIFLNHIENLHARSNRVSIRLGGNTEDMAVLSPPWFPNTGPTITKLQWPAPIGANFTNSPNLTVSEDLLYAMSNISSLVNVGWYYGLPFLNPTEIPTTIAAVTSILGSNIQGFEMANEPDQYQSHLKKPTPYGIPQYVQDFGNVRETYASGLTNILGPNVCCTFLTDEVLAANYLQLFGQFLAAFTIQHYKDSACPGTVNMTTPQLAFDSYLTHASVQNFVAPYLNSTNAVNAAGKDFILLETNTASCGGFPGASDSYAAALYLIDLALQAASVGMAQVMFHNGGVGQYYNLFTPPPGNQSSFRQWTTAAPYYSALVMAEVMEGGDNQVMDLLIGANNTNIPGYAIYNNGQPTKLALFNYITDTSGANDVTFQVTVPGAPISSVIVKYFSSATGSTADKFNLTWAGQTMGDQFTSDGRLKGTPSPQTVQCQSNVCNILVRAPQFALVLLNSQDLTNPTLATETFATTVQTNLHGNMLVPATVLATSNGRGGAQEAFNLGGTSGGSIQSGSQRSIMLSAGAVTLAGLLSAAWLLMR